MADVAEVSRGRWQELPVRWLLKFLRAEWSGALLAILILAVAIEAVTDGRPFFHPTNLLTILNNSAALGIVAGGMTLVILTSGIDLSVGSVMGMTAALTGYVASYMGVPAGAAIAFGLGAGAMVGLVHGVFVAYVGMPAFIVTLAGLSVWRGTGHLATGAQATPELPELFGYFGRWNPFTPLRVGHREGTLEGIWAPVGAFVDANWMTLFRTFQMSAILFVGFFVLLALVISNTKYGRYVYAIGSNARGARQAGIPTARYTAMTYVLCSMSAALGAMLFLGRAPYAKSDYGLMWELDAIAAVVIGGTSLFGGRGSVWGTFMGVILLKLINNGLTLAQLNTFWQMVVTGMIILLAVALDIVRQSRDPLAVRRFLAGLAAVMGVLAMMTPGGQWLRAAVALREHGAMQALSETGARLASPQAQRILSPAEVEALSAQMAGAALPSALLMVMVVAGIVALWRNTPLTAFAALAATAAGMVAAPLTGYAVAVPFLVLGAVGLAASLVVVPAVERMLYRRAL